jgi:hypothetical protein
LKEQGLTKSGIYYLLIRGTSFWYIKVYCDMEAANGGWTVMDHLFISLSLSLFLVDRKIKGKKRKKKISKWARPTSTDEENFIKRNKIY